MLRSESDWDGMGDPGPSMPPSGSTNSEEELFNFWLTVRTPLHPGSRPLPRKLWSVKSGIRIPLQSLLRGFPLQCLERQRKQNRTLLSFDWEGRPLSL
ncbi:hypothetical protein PR202_gb00248 [Eleusine coracana subsp. coracana]|uniref:Uncharacterized protein n=1 Tax=Eleusine coracana subsp. coracana TaxID=191504 RepID=A0AAV5DTF2_ELECO|nr:hypothetical protein PR202_gb00248 [Eleusine coracana subsp. coracana]